MTQAPDDVTRRRAALSGRLREARQSAKLTQEQTAIAAGLDRSFYVDVENGHHTLTVERLFSIADALGTTAAALLRDID